MKTKIITILIHDWVNQVIIKNCKCISVIRYLGKLVILGRLMRLIKSLRNLKEPIWCKAKISYFKKQAW
jgi:hypothetical protein